MYVYLSDLYKIAKLLANNFLSSPRPKPRTVSRRHGHTMRTINPIAITN